MKHAAYLMVSSEQADKLTCWFLCHFCPCLYLYGPCLYPNCCCGGGCGVGDVWKLPGCGCGFCFLASLHLLST